MSDKDASPFEKLPSDIKLHVFSFLNARNILNVGQTNKANYNFVHERAIWQMRMRLDFGLRVPDDTDAKAYYRQHLPLLNEREMMLSYVRAVFNASSIDDERVRPEKQKALIEEIHQAMQLHGTNKALVLTEQMAHYFPDVMGMRDHKDEVEAVYQQLFIEKDTKLLVSVLEHMCTNSNRHLTYEQEMATLMLQTIGVFALTGHVKQLMSRVPQQLIKGVKDVYLPRLLKSGMTQLNDKFIAALLEGGLRAEQTLDEANRQAIFSAPMLYFLPLSLMNLVTQREEAGAVQSVPLDEKLASAQQIAEMLRSNGADANAEIVGNWAHALRGPATVSDIINQFYEYIPFMQLSDQECVKLTETLQFIQNSPNIEQKPADAEIGMRI